MCNGVDDDCDGYTDDYTAADVSTWYQDIDGDGYGDATASVGYCDQPAGYVEDASDCVDTDARVNPGAVETCNSLDDNCDGLTDDASASGQVAWYADTDGDGYGSSTTTTACDAPAGYVAAGGDCDDADAAFFPGALESCTEPEDLNCDGYSGYTDNDGDSWAACEECDDGDYNTRPDAVEMCNGIDDDCDGSTDDPSSEGQITLYEDVDVDGYGSTTRSISVCYAIAGWVATSGDCDDADPSYHPGAAEVCTDPEDYDCDGYTRYADADLDGIAACEDCDDSNPIANPSAEELCNGVDDDCDGSIDEDPVDGTVYYVDADGDGHGAVDSTTACEQPARYAATFTDCDDLDANRNPDAYDQPEDGIDQDCLGGDAWRPFCPTPCSTTDTAGAAWALALAAFALAGARRSAPTE